MNFISQAPDAAAIHALRTRNLTLEGENRDLRQQITTLVSFFFRTIFNFKFDCAFFKDYSMT